MHCKHQQVVAHSSRQVDKLVLKFLSGTRVDPRPHEQFVRLDLLAGQRRRPELAFGIA
jgi:hypothetical protein